MNDKQMSLVLVGLIAFMAGGFLFMLLRTEPNVTTDKRLTDVRAETLAGHMGVTTQSEEKKERVKIGEHFESFEGKSGETKSSWPHFRGADYSNISQDTVPLANSWLAAGPPVLWTIDLSEGHSGAAIWKGRVYLMDYDVDRQGDALRVFSMADGQEIWRRWYKSPTKVHHGISRTVPAVTDKYVVTIGPKCHVMCVDTDTGKLRWGVDMLADYGTLLPEWYTAQCPLIDNDVAVVAPCGKEVLMMGIDCDTGNIIWRTPNPGGWNMSHSSIIPMTLLGKKQYVYCSVNGVVGVGAEGDDQGELLWKTPAWAHGVTSPSPVKVDDERIFLTVGYGGGSMMLRLKEEGGEIKAEPVFELTKKVFACEQQTPIFHDGHVFGILPNDGGGMRNQFACLNTDGKVVWSSGKSERFGFGPFLQADGKIFILNDNGELTLIRASTKGYERLAQCRPLKGRDAWAPMAIVDGKLILRDSETVICLDVRASGPQT